MKKKITSNKKGLIPLQEMVRFLPRILIFIALLFFIYGIIDAVFSKKPTLASIDFDRITRDIDAMDNGETINSPISAKWYVNHKGYRYIFYENGENKQNCPERENACMCIYGGDLPECRSFKGIDFKKNPRVNLDMGPGLKYKIEIIKEDCGEDICHVSLTLK